MKKRDKQHEMYMANAKILLWVPNATYILLTRVGVSRWGNANFRAAVGGDANFSIFRYQHVGIGKQNRHVGGLTQLKALMPVVLRRSGI